MKYKSIACMFALISMLASMLAVIPASAQNGPRTSDLLIHVYSTDVAEFEAFQSNTGTDAIDFIDWPLPVTKIKVWQTPGHSDKIELRDYSDTGVYEIDLNNQRWPTGVTEPRTFDPATGTFKHYYGTNQPWDDKALEFRKAIAYLSDKNTWIRKNLKPLGYRLDTMVPIPALAGWTDYPDLEVEGLIYHYNRIKAAQILDDAGFVQGNIPNPYYDKKEPGSAEFLRTDPRYGGVLQPLRFIIRMDDEVRRNIGRELTAQMRKAGIQVLVLETPRVVCLQQSMVLYDYHLYTGGWSANIDIPLSLWEWQHSSQYWGGTAISYFDGTPWSANYAGLCDHVLDGYLDIGKSSGDFHAIKQAVLDAQKRVAQLVGVIPAYSRGAVKAFKRGWTGVVNQRAHGPDNRWTFLNSINTINTPSNPADNEIDWGFMSTLSDPNPITTNWLWDQNFISLIYDSLITRSPYDLSMDYGVIAESWSFDPDEASALYTLRSGCTFHNGDPVTPEDVKFSLEFMRACGPGVAWEYSEVAPIQWVHTQADDPTLGPRDVEVGFSTSSYFAVHLAGYRPILDHNIWNAVNIQYGWGYTRGMVDFSTFPQRMLVKAYEPWTNDVDNDGSTDLEEDGSGPWAFQSYAPVGPISVATSISLSAFTNYIIPQTTTSSFLTWAYRMLGDVNQDGIIDTNDGYAIQKALGTDTSYPWGTDWDQYNPNADINYGTWDMIGQTPEIIGDGFVNYLDLGKWGVNYGVKS